MDDSYNLTTGNILKILFKVSVPVMLTAFVQMAYNLTDLFWLGKAASNDIISNGYVASAGFGGFFTWLGAAVILLVRIGAEVRVSQNYGRKDYDSAKGFGKTGVQLELIFAVIFSLVLLIFAKFWIGLFNIQSAKVYADSVLYLQIITFGMTFYLINPVLSATLHGTGNTLIPFLISATGLVFNMILDPVLILVYNLDIKGAAIATIISQFIVTVIFIIYFKYKDTILRNMKLFSRIDLSKAKDILKLGYPVAIQSAIFTFISMYISSLVTPFGETANAVQKVGSQIESLSWLVAGGFQTALGAFVGQNFGANKNHRVIKGIRYALISMTIYGAFISLIMFFQARNLFSLLLNNNLAIPLGIDYLKILAFSQLAMIIESTVGGAFNGLGKTVPQSLVSLSFNLLRIPLAYYFIPIYGLNGIWLAITISSVFKGLVIYVWFKIYIKFNAAFKQEVLTA